MEAVIAIIGSEAVLNLILSGVAALVGWVVTKVSKGYIQEQNAKKAKECILAAVSDLGELAKKLKVKNEDGKLTEAQKEELNRNARLKAQDIGRELGLDIMQILGSDIMNLTITQGVKLLKKKVFPNPELPQEIKELLP